MVNRGLRPLFENPRLSRCAHSHSSVRRANINFFTLIFFTCAKDFAQEEGRNVVKLLLYSEDYWQTFAAHNDNSKLLELFTPLALRRNPRQMLDSHQTLLLMSIHLKKNIMRSSERRKMKSIPFSPLTNQCILKREMSMFFFLRSECQDYFPKLPSFTLQKPGKFQGQKIFKTTS